MSKKNGGCGPRCVALVGPYGSGKTTLLESILFVSETIQRKGSVPQKNTVGDSSAEARARQMSVEVNCATAKFIDESFTFLDCPGSIEFLQETLNLLPGVDAAVVVCEPEPAKVQMLRPYLKRLADLKIPHFLFLNKIDKATGSLRDVLAMLQEASDTPFLLRQIPIWKDGQVDGFVDLALERAWIYRGSSGELVEIDDKEREKQARFQMLEKLADYDEHLMEELLSDIEPPRDEIFSDLARELSEGLIVPALIGAAEGDHGVLRLLKALRHEVPEVKSTAERTGIPSNGDAVACVLKTYHSSHGGKLSLARVFSGVIKEGAVLHTRDGQDVRVGGICALRGEAQTKLPEARGGDTVALLRLDHVATGDLVTSGKTGGLPKIVTEQLPPVYRLAIEAVDRKDEVKLTAAIQKLREEDPSLSFEQSAELHEMSLVGQGEIHLKVAVERLQSKYGLRLTTHPSRIPYKETIRKPTKQRGRHKRQTGGHGQFGDVVLEIRPLPRGSGFVFEDEVVGGVVPRQWIPSVEKGVVEYLKAGPLGFPVVDIAVRLIDGSYHSVDSSDAAFQIAGRLAMSEGMPNCSPVLLEPIMHVRVHVPNDATAKVNAVVSGRRGQLMGFDVRDGWKGWDTVEAQMPLAEIGNLIVDLRSLTQGVGTFEMEFDHLAELTGKLADHVIATHKAAA
jgi:elongation factor G